MYKISMIEKKNKYSGLLYFIDSSPLLFPKQKEVDNQIVEICREIIPPYLLQMVDEFNKLQLENFSLNLRCYALRRFIENFVLCIEERFNFSII